MPFLAHTLPQLIVVPCSQLRRAQMSRKERAPAMLFYYVCGMSPKQQQFLFTNTLTGHPSIHSLYASRRQCNAATANEELSHCTFDRQRRCRCTEELFRPFIQLIVIQSQHLTEYLIILIQEYQARTEAATTSS